MWRIRRGRAAVELSSDNRDKGATNWDEARGRALVGGITPWAREREKLAAARCREPMKKSH